MRVSGYLERPDYRVDLLRRRNHVAVHAGATLVAASERAIIVDEQGHGFVFYLPPDAIIPGTLVPIDAAPTFCPYKGEASYFALAGTTTPIAWSYAAPFVEVAAIADHIAFYHDRVAVTVAS